VPERRIAVIDLGSNSFRLVVFSASPELWHRTDELYEAVRIGEGAGEEGELRKRPMARALSTLELFAHFCRARGLGEDDVRPVATSAIRDAPNRAAFLERAEDALGMPIEVLSAEEEARYGFLAAVNSTTLTDGVVLDLGGGSLQLVAAEDREERHVGSWPLGAVRTTERFLADGEPAGKKQLKALRAHVLDALSSADWLEGSGERLVGLGGTVRNLAVAAQLEAGLPSTGVQGFALTREALDDLVARLAALPAAERADVPGIKAARGDLILAGAATIQAVLDAVGADAIEVTEAGLREGVFFEEHLAPGGTLGDVRAASVLNLFARYPVDPGHTRHVATLALQMYDDLAEARLLEPDPVERELLWAAAMLHDIGMTVDYDDHHKHSRYLILNAGLPGFSQREAAIVAQIARYHRKGRPGLGPFSALGRKGDRELVARCSAVLRLAEHLERSRDQQVRAARVELHEGDAMLRLEGGDVDLARSAAERQTDLFERAFDAPLRIEGG
jgi:exopolyphosphatase / guanosine-5'-triphosphate,3'-diphosphate pyrophosphatase